MMDPSETQMSLAEMDYKGAFSMGTQVFKHIMKHSLAFMYEILLRLTFHVSLLIWPQVIITTACITEDMYHLINALNIISPCKMCERKLIIYLFHFVLKQQRHTVAFYNRKL